MLKLDNTTIYVEIDKWRVHLAISPGFTFFTPKDPTPTPLAQWDVSAVTKFNSLFAHPKFDASFWKDQDISNWKFHDTEPITMARMFCGSRFSGTGLANWDVGRVTDMSEMFAEIPDFDLTEISQWDVSNVTDMQGMFQECGCQGDGLENWDVSRVTNMANMFCGSGFDGDGIEKWDVGSVTDMAEMFAYCHDFDYPGIARWNVSNVTDMSGMFRGTKFNGDISGWDVRKVTNMSEMFANTVYFNQSLSDWNVTSVKKLKGMFWDAISFTCAPVSWVDKLPSSARHIETYIVFGGSQLFQKVQTLPKYLDDFLEQAATMTIQQGFVDRQQLIYALYQVETNNNPVVGHFGHITNWDVSRISDFTRMASQAFLHAFNYDISGWTFGYHPKGLSFDRMFQGLPFYNQPFHFKKPANDTMTVNLTSMFSHCPKLNSPISFSGVRITTMTNMFEKCHEFNAPVTIKSDVAFIESTDRMFANCTCFNQPVQFHGVTYIERMNFMFYDCRVFNQPIDWFVESDRAEGMMLDCKAFNQSMRVNALRFHDKTCVAGMFTGCVSLQKTVSFERCQKNFTIPTFDYCRATFQMHMDPTIDIVSNYSSHWNRSHAEFNQVTEYARRYQNPEPHRTVTLPWRVRIETWNNESVPILVIPRGTLLFTGRKMYTPDAALSMRHLWKLATAPSYTDQNLGKDLITYFYPIPYMNQVIARDFRVLDVVETTQDFRLICLVRPSHLTRGHRRAEDVSFLSPCPMRAYDLCMSRQFMEELRLQGYMGIAGMDSISTRGDVLSQIDILVQACAVSTHENDFYVGVPEIALISPVCIEDLDAMNEQHAAAVANRPLPKPVPFQSVHQFSDINTAQLIRTIHAEFQTNDRWSDLIGASRQAPCMLFVNKHTTSLPPELYESIDHVFTQRDYQLEISYRNEDPKIIVAIQQGGYFLSNPRHRLRGAGKRSQKRSPARSDWVVKTFGCMPIVLRREIAKRPLLSTRRRLVTPRRKS